MTKIDGISKWPKSLKYRGRGEQHHQQHHQHQHHDEYNGITWGSGNMLPDL